MSHRTSLLKEGVPQGLEMVGASSLHPTMASLKHISSSVAITTASTESYTESDRQEADIKRGGYTYRKTEYNTQLRDAKSGGSPGISIQLSTDRR